MKKFYVFAAMALAAAMNFSCSDVDNPSPTIDVFQHEGKDYLANVVGTFKAEPGTEVTLTLGIYGALDVFGVDFGDGTIVTDSVFNQNGGLKGEDGLTVSWRPSATKFTGTVAGEGNITVYGNSDLWYMNLSGGVVPTSFDQPRFKKLNQVSITGADMETVVLPQLDSLKQFSFNNSSAKSVDVSKAPRLTSLTINSTTASKFEPALASIDLSNNPELTYLSLQGNNKTSGKLTSLDLTNNTKLESVYVQYNQISQITLADKYEKLGMINMQDNQIAEFDFTRLPYIKDIYAQNNKLGEVDLSKMTRTGGNVYFQNNQLEELVVPVSVKYLYANDNQLTKISIADATTGAYMQNNKLTIATLPVKPAGLNTAAKIKRFVYAPQAALEVPAEVEELDLSAQLKAQGILTEPATTAYSFVTASGAVLSEGNDYTVTAPGKFKFLRGRTEKVHGVMTNEALPLFTGANAFVTTEFTIKSNVIVESKAWDFTTWSAATVANLKADAAASSAEGWSDIEKATDTAPTELSKDNCFWATIAGGGTLKANGVEIAELKGLVFDAEYAAKRSLAIAVNYPETSLGTYAGASYLWLGGGGKKQTCACFTIPGVKAGQKVTFVAESHKPTDARGVQIYANSYEAANQIGDAFKPMTQESHSWTIEKDCDVVVWNTSGCHIYKITVE